MARSGNLVALPERLEWDLFLNENADFKSDVFANKELDPRFRLDTLHADLPRYIWRAVAYSKDVQQFELLFDATDLLQGSHFLQGLPYVAPTCLAIGTFMNDPAIQSYIQSAGPRSAFKSARWFGDLVARL